MTAPTIRSYMQIFSRFGGTRCRKVHFSTFSGKLTFQSSRNGLQNPPFCPGSLQDTFIIYSSISHQHLFPQYVPQKNLENRQSENLKFQNFQLTNKCPAVSEPGEIEFYTKTVFPVCKMEFRGIRGFQEDRTDRKVSADLVVHGVRKSTFQHFPVNDISM